MKAWIPAIALPTILLLTDAGAADAQQPLEAEEVYRHPRLDVVVPDFPAEGLILDIGGGGEGVIAQVKGKQVVAVDLSRRELEETPPASDPLLKVVMDARDLRFLDRTFATTTAFFTFMYIAPADHEKALREIHRVLKDGGRLLIWDAVFPTAKPDPRQHTIVFPLSVRLPRGQVETGYGVRFQEGQNAAHFVALAKKVGFDVVTSSDRSGWFLLELQKGR
jgi:SAM-dependent methyltransferase